MARGASVIQERSYAYAMKSSMWLLDPRPDLPTIVRMVEKGFELSEASHAPVMLELRIRACHVTGSFTAKDNRRAPFSGINRISGPPRFNYARLAHPPLTFVQESLKVEDRLPAALAFIRDEKLNEILPGDLADVGIIAMGGLTSSVLRALLRLDLADLYGATRVPILVLNAVYPLVPEEIRAFCSGKRAVLVVEEGSPDYIEQQVNVELRRADIKTRVFGKGALPKTGEYTSDVLLGGLARFLSETAPRGIDAQCAGRTRNRGSWNTRQRPHKLIRRTAATPAKLLYGLSGTTGVCRHQADAARTRADPHQRRHRLPRIRNFRTVWPGQFDPRLRHVAGERGRGRGQTRSPSYAIMGDGGFLAQWSHHRRDVKPVQQGRRRPDRDAKRIRVGDRVAICAVEQGGPSWRAAGHGHRENLALAWHHVAAQGAYLFGRHNDGNPQGGDADRGARPQGHHCGRRMPACAPKNACVRKMPTSSSAARAWSRPLRVSMTKSARAIIPAFACRAAHR